MGFSEPAVNQSQQFARSLHLSLVAPEAREAHCGAKFLASADAQQRADAASATGKMSAQSFRWASDHRPSIFRTADAAGASMDLRSMGQVASDAIFQFPSSKYHTNEKVDDPFELQMCPETSQSRTPSFRSCLAGNSN